MNGPKIDAMDFGSNCRLGVCFQCLICFWFYVYNSLVFSVYYQLWICSLVWLLSSFYIYIYIIYIYIYIERERERERFYFSFFSFCECVSVCFFLWFCLLSLAFTICPRVLSIWFIVFIFLFLFFVLGFVSSFSSEPCGWQGLGAQAGCWARASEVEGTSPIHWTSRRTGPI